MKTMIIIESEEERAQFKAIWDEAIKAKQNGERHPLEGNHIENALCSQLRGNANLFENHAPNGNRYAIVYVYDNGWHIYNFNTLDEDYAEGFAELCGVNEGNFPFFD